MHPSARPPRRLVAGAPIAAVALVGGLTLPAALAAASPSTAHAAPVSASAGPSAAGTTNMRHAAGAWSYGSLVTGNDVVRSGRTAYSSMCTNDRPTTVGNYAADTDPQVESQVDAHGVRTRNLTHLIDGDDATTSLATVSNAELADGAIVVSDIRSFSRVVAVGDGRFVPTNTTQIAALSVNGEPVPLDLGGQPVSVPVPGVGTLDLNRQQHYRTGAGAVAATEALRLTMDDGTVVVLGKSFARLDDTRGDVFRGAGYAVEVTRGTLASSGRTANQPLSCGGTGGDVRTNSTGGVDLGGLVDLGEAQAHAFTGRRDGGPVAWTSAEISQVTTGDLQLGALTAKATVSRGADGRLVRSAAGSGLASVRYAGEELVPPARGERLDLPGLGYLSGPTVERTPNGLRVTAARLTLTDNGEVSYVVHLGNASTSIAR